MAQSVTAQSHSTHDPAINMVAPPPLATVPLTGPAAESSNLRGTAAEHGGTSHQGGLVTTTDLGPVLEQLQAFPPLPPRSMHALGYASNETLARVQLGSTRFSPPDPQSQADHNLRVDQLAQRMDDQNALIRQLINQISVAQNLGLGQPGEERRIDERAGGQLNGHQAGRAGVSRQRDAQPRDQLADMSQASASHTQSNDWFHTLPSGSINSFKELAYVFTKEYTSYRTIKKNPDHLFNLRKKPDESIRDYIKRFKAEKANIVGCDDQIASSAFKKGLPAEHELYRELTITPSQTLAEVFATAERYALWDDDRIAAKKSTEQGDRPTKRAGQRSDGFSNKNMDKRRSHPQGDTKAGENYTKFTIPIHQILAQVKNKPWAIQQIEDRDAAKEPSQKVIRINTILADSEEYGLTSKEKKRKIKQATMISQISTDLPLAEDDPVIGFQKKDLIGLDLPHNDALVISIQIAQAMVDRIHADEGSAANILQLAVIQQMGLETKINKSAKSLTGFNGATTVTVGTIELDVYAPPVISLQMFMVIDEVSPYNGILGRPWISRINAITSATHQKIRYPIPGGVEGIRPEVYPEEGWKPEEDVELVPLDPDKPERTARIGSRLNQEEKAELAAFLQNNKDVFAWSPSDMPGIDPQIICHRLHVNPAIKPVAQKRRNFAPERVAIIEAEIDKLLAAGFIEEVSYAEWLANVVLVAKKR
ncbi:unnamed protein product [Prunus brigantina]